MEATISNEIDRILEKMKLTDNQTILREYALTVESLVVSLMRIKK